jgi:alkylation response protein AidB-like acyl-CoA dehydrogenase
MEFALTPEQAELRGEVIRFARERLSPGAADRDREHRFERELWRECGQMGLLGLPVAEEWGGSGLDPLTCAIVLDGLGLGCDDGGLVFSVCAHLLSCVVPIATFGTADQKRAHLQGLCDGTLVGVHAMSEADSGSDAFAMRTTAVRVGAGWQLTGAKTFISNGPIADIVIAFAMTDRAKGFHGGVTAFLVPRGTSGFRQGPPIEKLGLRSSPLGELVFDDVVLPEDAVLGGVGGGARVFTHAMDWERTCLFAAQVGQAERLLLLAIEYARTRRQFGQAIGKFQAVSHRLADLKVEIEAARLLVYQAAWRLGQTRTASLDAAIAKLAASETLLRTALAVIQVFGGYGYMVEYQVERGLRDAVGSTIYSGTSEMQRNIIARWIGL